MVFYLCPLLVFCQLLVARVAQGSRECRVYDDPTVSTFDNTYVHYHGSCQLIYTQPCTTNSLPATLGIPYFKVYGQNNKIYSSSGSVDPTYPTTVGLEVESLNVNFFLENTGSYGSPQIEPKMIFFGNVITILSLPFLMNGITVDVDPQKPSGYIIDSLFGLSVYMTPNDVYVKLGQSLALYTREKLCGLCGQHNYDGSTGDFTHANGDQFLVLYDGYGVPYVSQDFYEPYVTETPTGCTKDPRYYVGGKRKKRETACSGRQYAKAKKLCGLINDPKGPFASCYNQTTGREARYQGCITVMCLDEAFGCASLEGYAGYCGQFGELGAWRSEAKCPLECREGQVYSVVASRECIPTCYDPDPCPDLKPNMKGKKAIKGGIFQEGCVCEPGLVWNGSGCVSQDNCPSMLRELSPEQKCRGLFGKKRGECMKAMKGE